MFKHQYKVVVLILCALASYLAWYTIEDNPTEQSFEKSIGTLLEVAGISQQVQQFPGLFKGSVQQNAQQGMIISPAQHQAILSSIDSSVLPSSILAGLSREIEAAISQDEVEGLIAWFQSPLGKKVAKAEQSAQSNEAYQQMLKHKKSLLANTQRLAFAERLDALLSAVEMTSKIQQNMQIAVNATVLLALAPEQPLDMDELLVELQSAGTQINPALEQMVLVSFVYSYQDLSDEELNSYEDFLNQSTTKRFNRLVISAINTGLENAILKWLEASAVVLAMIEPEEFED
jgi:hypothetical protein